MPKGSIRNPGTKKTASTRFDRMRANQGAKLNSTVGKQMRAKAANEWNEYRAAGTDTAGHATKSLRKSMRDVRSNASVGGTLARTKENPVKALKRRAKTKTTKKK